MAASPEQLLAIHEVGPEISRSVASFFQEERNRAVIRKLQELGVHIEAKPRKESAQAGDLPFKQKTVVFTGGLERWSREAAKRRVEELGGAFHWDHSSLGRLAPDIIIECTGAPSVIRDCLGATAAAGILCLAGVGAVGELEELDIARLNRTLVLENQVQFGTVNANRAHYELAADALARADPAWLGRLITRRVPLERWS